MDVGDAATLSVRVQADGIDQVKRDLADVGTAGQATAARFSDAFKQSSASAMDFARAGATANQIAQLTGQSMAAARDAVQRYGDQIAQTAAEARGLALAQEEMAVAGMGLASVNNTVTASFDMAGAGLGRVRQGLVSLVSQATGTIPVIDRLGVSLLSGFGVEQPVMIGVLAGIAAVIFAWKAMQTDADVLAKKVAESMKKVREETNNAQLAMGDLQLRAAQDAYDKASDALVAANKNKSQGGLGNDSGDIQRTAKENFDKALADLIHWQGEKSRVDYEMKAEADKNAADTLSTLIRSGNATAAERQRALELYKKDIAEIAKLGQTQTDNVRRLALIQQSDELSAALSPKSSIKGPAGNVFTVEQERIIDDLIKQREQLRLVNEENIKANNLSDQAAQLAKVQGEAHAFLVIQYKAFNDVVDANGKFVGAALTERLATIEADRQQSIETLKQTTATKDREAAELHLNEAVKGAQKIGADNVKVIQEQTAAAKKLADTIQADLLHAVTQLTSGGSLSWSSFFKAAESASSHMVQQLSSDIDQLRKKEEEARAKHETAQAAAIAADIARYTEYLQKVKDINAAFTGATIGYSIGQQTGSTGGGLLGGAGAGALSGFEIAGPQGAVIGGLAGAAGGLLGAAKAQQEAAAALRAAAQQFMESVSTYAASATGNSVTQSIANAQKTYTDLYQQADQLFFKSALSMKDWHNQLDSIDKTFQKIMDKIGADFWAGITQQLNALAGASGAYANQIAAVEKAYADNMESAKALGATQQQLAELEQLRVKTEQQLADAYAESQAQLNYSLDAREKYALGLKGEGDAITRKAAEEKELFDAEAAGWTAEQIARLQYIQGLEDQKKAEDDAKAALERYTQSMASLTAQFLSLTGDVNAAATAQLAEQQRQDRNSLVSAGGTPQELALQGVVQLFQRGQLAAQQEIAAQTTTLNAQLKTQQSALTIAQSQLQALQQAASSLKTFDQSLNTGSLSPLSPIDQLNAARANRDKLFAAAQGGDATAAGQYGTAAQAFLQLSQGYNASGAGYQSDYQSTKQQADALSAQYDKQASLQQQTVDALNASIKLLQDQLAQLQDANTLAQRTRDAVIAELQRDRDTALSINGPLIDQFNALRDTLSGVGRDIVTSERDILVGDQNNVTSATAAEIAAINAGASAQQIATLDAVRVLELQKTATDDGFARQIATMGSVFGYGSPQVQEIIRLQMIYDEGVNAQIDAINGVTSAISYLKNTDPSTLPIDKPQPGGTIPRTLPVTRPTLGGVTSGDSASSDALAAIVAQTTATVAVLQAGLSQLVAAQSDTSDQLSSMTDTLRRGLERIA